MESHMASMDNVGQDHKGIFLGELLKVGLMELAMGIWIYTNGLSSEIVGDSPWTSLWSRPKKLVIKSHA
jgi:hypothetical protein